MEAALTNDIYGLDLRVVEMMQQERPESTKSAD